MWEMASLQKILWVKDQILATSKCGKGQHYLFVVVSNVDDDEAKLVDEDVAKALLDEDEAKALEELVLPSKTLGAIRLAFFSGISDLE